MAKPKHDYDSEDFYKRIEALAMNGYTDEEVANELNLSREVFGCMKMGTMRIGLMKKTKGVESV